MKTLAILIVSIITTFSAYSQEIEANVFVNTEQLETEYLYYVSSMADDVMRYINNTKYLDRDWEGDPIPVEINIVLSSIGTNKFSAQMFIVSKRMVDSPEGEEGWSIALKIIEKNWAFEYALGANFNYSTTRFDRFVSMIDYYMLLVIGYDLDTYGELDGAVAFDKAKIIFSNGSSAGIDGFGTNSSPGEYSKYNIISELTDMRYNDLRKLFFAYYVDGLDLAYIEPERAMENLVAVIERMVEFKNNKLSSASIIMDIFFDTKARELAATFNGYTDRKIFNYLMELDPANTMIFQDARDGKFK